MGTSRCLPAPGHAMLPVPSDRSAPRRSPSLLLYAVGLVVSWGTPTRGRCAFTPNPTQLLHSTLGPTLLASPTASAGARPSLAAEEDPSVAEHSSILGRGNMSSPFHRDPKIETGQSLLPRRGRRRGFQGQLPGHHFSACSQLHVTPRPRVSY